MARNQDSSARQALKMDSRKFLGALNDSAQSRVAFFEDRIANIGKHAGQRLRLVALHAKNLFFEDVDTNTFFVADHARDKGGKVTVSNVRKVEIVEEEKAQLFAESCLKLVNAIEENNQKGMGAAFKRMSAQRFSSRVVPHSGVVRGRDNIARKIVISGNNIGEDTRHKLISAIVESLRDRVIVENGQVVSGQFTDGQAISLPVTKWASRKLVARRMRDFAQNAYWSEGFQNRIQHCARLIAEGKISDAVKSIAPFLNENEEFTLLKRNQIQTLIENALAAKAIFNDRLVTDTATLFYRTNMRISRNKIIDEWRNIAKKSEHVVLAENVQILESAANFEPAYDKFLTLIFEAFSNKEVAASALATALESLRDKTPKIKESSDLSSKLNGLINRLSDKDCDDAAIYEAEDLIATIQEELSAADNLSNFDMMPGDDLDVGAELSNGQPIININSPLIQIGGKSGSQDAVEDQGELDDAEFDVDDDELSALLAAPDAQKPAPAPTTPAAPAPAAPAAPAPAAPGANPFESKRSSTKTINESRPVHYEMKDEDDDDHSDSDSDCDMNESSDPYAIASGELQLAEGSLLMSDYGAPVITDSADVRRVVRIIEQLAQKHDLSGERLKNNLVGMSEAAIKASGLRIPEGRMSKAIEQCIEMFESENPYAEHDQEDSDDDAEDTEVAEDQFKGPRIRRRGYGKNSYAAGEIKKESVEWVRAESDGVLGKMAGVNFIFDHGGESEMKPVILSEDGSVEIPIPEQIVESAFASAGLIEGDSQDFEDWLSESIEQLRAISDDEDVALSEAMATIKTHPDGSISVEVTDDVDVDDNVLPNADDDTAFMEPVDSIEPKQDVDSTDGMDNAMPDFESFGDSGDNEEDTSDDLGDGDEDADEDVDDTDDDGDDADDGDDTDVDDEDDDEMFEDKDITDPKNSKYTKHVKENHRGMPDHKIAKDGDDDLEGIGPEVKKDDGSGTNPPTARPISKQ
jgi:hypothetical protein